MKRLLSVSKTNAHLHDAVLLGFDVEAATQTCAGSEVSAERVSRVDQGGLRLIDMKRDAVHPIVQDL